MTSCIVADCVITPCILVDCELTHRVAVGLSFDTV